ncbi:hypothetical protein ABBQ38_005396 [Trebouxia sp. C0009 RCD-2024]
MMQKDRDCRRVLRLEVAVNELADHKRRLLETNNIRTEVCLPLERATEPLRAARITSLSKDELYNLQIDDDFFDPINPRNEAAALAMLLEKLGRHV